MNTPGFLTMNWLIRGIATRYVRDALQGYAKGRVLDVGCGAMPHAAFIKGLPGVTGYTGLDRADTMHLKGTDKADVVSDAYNLPVGEIFGTVLCSWVLEHLEEPEEALREMRRVLEDEGIVILSTNFLYHIHEAPRDFYRYSSYGLEYLFRKTGFEIIALSPMTGFWVTFGQELAYYLHKFSRPVILKPVVLAASVAIQVFSLCMEKLDKDTRFTANYTVVARKRAGFTGCPVPEPGTI